MKWNVEKRHKKGHTAAILVRWKIRERDIYIGN